MIAGPSSPPRRGAAPGRRAARRRRRRRVTRRSPAAADDRARRCARSGRVVPGLRDELVDRARTAGLLIGWVAVVAVPAWTVVDRIAVPQLAAMFLVVRLVVRRPDAAGDVRAVAAAAGPPATGAADLRRPGDRPDRDRLDDHPHHRATRTTCSASPSPSTAAAASWSRAPAGRRPSSASWARARRVRAPRRPGDAPCDELVAVIVYLGTASVIATLAHLRRYALNTRELITRVRLEREQQRTASCSSSSSGSATRTR